jgi:hypothetical protein
MRLILLKHILKRFATPFDYDMERFSGTFIKFEIMTQEYEAQYLIRRTDDDG